jgi:hypothetical protein
MMISHLNWFRDSTEASIVFLWDCSKNVGARVPSQDPVRGRRDMEPSRSGSRHKILGPEPQG